MFLKVGFISFFAAVMFAVVVAVVVATGAEKAETTVAAKPVAETEPTVSESSVPVEIVRPEPKKKAPKSVKPAPKPEPQPEPEPQPKPAPIEPLQVEDDWPEPKTSEVAETEKPRRYRLPPGAIMGLTIRDMDLYNAPVFSSNGQKALDSGVAHVPQTSLPWSRGQQRNVYLAGHRLGYEGTGSRMIFYRLGELARGDEVALKDRDGKSYKYRVIESFVAKPNDSWVMGEVRDRDLLTLQTCTLIPTFEKRLIVRAERI